MHLTRLAAVMTIVFLFACADSSAQQRSTSSRQLYRVHVPREVNFGLQAAAFNLPSPQPVQEDAQSLVFMADTTSGVTIQFETKSESSPLKLTVGGRQRGNWWARDTKDQTGSKGESVAEANSVQASTLRPGWTTLKLDVAEPPVGSDEEVTTIVITIVAH